MVCDSLNFLVQGSVGAILLVKKFIFLLILVKKIFVCLLMGMGFTLKGLA